MSVCVRGAVQVGGEFYTEVQCYEKALDIDRKHVNSFRLPAGGRGDVIVALEPVQWANNFRLIPYGERPRLYCDTGGAQLGVTVRMA